MRRLNEHKTNPVNEQIEIIVTDQIGPGGANHRYEIHLPDTVERFGLTTILHFQNGPIKEAGVNGLTHEALLAVLIDRLEGFQSGQYKHPSNQMAKEHLELAMECLQARTKEREARGVEGTSTV